MNVEWEIMSLFALLQRCSEKADWAAAFSMRVRYSFMFDIVNFIIEYIELSVAV